MFAYMGGKSRIYKKLINFMEAERGENMTWVEPFMGSGKVLFNVKGPRIGNDINHELIALFKAVQNGYEPPSEVSEDEYNHIKHHQELYPDYLKGFVSFACSFGGSRWGGYQRGENRNFALESKRAIERNKNKIKDVVLYSSDYKTLNIPPSSLIYCDPPYINTRGYGFKFDQKDFLYWCKEMVKDGHLVFISEYNLPREYEIVWEQEVFISRSKSGSRNMERLYRLHKPKQFALRRY